MTSNPAQSPAQSAPVLTLAAVDLGSNSFHMIVMRQSEAGLQVVDRIREPVRLAVGLQKDKTLDPETRARALDCMQRFGQILRDIPGGQVRVLGTNTLRRLRSSLPFFIEAEQALGHPIEVISGVEEARLIYGGVAHGLAGADERRLVVDIGGGSTELIVGVGPNPKLMESVHMGCVSFTQRFFPDGKISPARLQRARQAATSALQFLSARYRRSGWDRAIGASGSVRSVWHVAAALGFGDDHIHRDGLEGIGRALMGAGHISKIDFEGLRADRAPVFVGSWAVLAGVFDALRIDAMDVSDRALREGVIYDLLGRLQHADVRDASARQLADRFAVDQDQVERVSTLADHLFQGVASVWKLDKKRDRRYLRWACQLHEIGLAISHSAFHKHGAYVLAQADIHGFSRRDQIILAALVRVHRGKLRAESLADLPPPWPERALRLAVILRLAVLLNRNRTEAFPISDLELNVRPERLRLALPAAWLSDHALTVADVDAESERLKAHGLRLKLREREES